MIIISATPPPAPTGLTAFQQRVREQRTALEEAAAIAGTVLRRMHHTMQWGLASPHERTLILARWTTRYYTRAGQDTTVDAADLAHAVLAGRDQETRWMGPAERAQVAAAVLRGLVECRPAEAESSGVLAWHRLIGDTAVEVHRG